MTLLWLIILGFNGHRWRELHPWTITFVVVFIAAILDSGLVFGRGRRK